MLPVTFRKLLQSRLFQLSVKAGLTLLAFWFVFKDIDFGHLLHIVHTQDHMLLVEASLLMATQIVLGGARWCFMLNALSGDEPGSPRLSMRLAQKIYYISGFFITCLPGAVGGDMVRVWMTRSDHIPIGLAVNSVIIDRMLALVCILILMLLTLPVLSQALDMNLGWVYAASAVTTLVALVLLYVTESVLSRWHSVRVVGWALYLLRSIKRLLAHPGVLTLTVVMALAAHVCYALSGFVLAESMGMPMTVLQSLTFFPIVMFVTTLPISFGGWGVREAATVWLLGLVGIQAEAAVALSIQLALLYMIMSLPGGLMWFMHRKGRAPMEKAPLSIEPL